MSHWLITLKTSLTVCVEIYLSRVEPLCSLYEGYGEGWRCIWQNGFYFELHSYNQEFFYFLASVKHVYLKSRLALKPHILPASSQHHVISFPFPISFFSCSLISVVLTWLLSFFFLCRDGMKSRSPYCLGREPAVSGTACYTDLSFLSVCQSAAQSGM